MSQHQNYRQGSVRAVFFVGVLPLNRREFPRVMVPDSLALKISKRDLVEVPEVMGLHPKHPYFVEGFPMK